MIYPIRHVLKTVHIPFPYRNDETGKICEAPLCEEVVTDFITELLTLLPSYRLYSLRTPGAKDRRVQDHRRLNHPVAELCGESLLPGLVDRHESMAQGEVKLLDE